MAPEKTTHRVNKLRHFIGDGIWASACEGFAEANFNAFSTYLMTSPDKLSYLSASQNFLGCWLQLWSEKLVRILGSRKLLVLICVCLQTLLLLALLPLILIGISSWVFMALVLVFSALGSLCNPVWNTWVSELLPKRRRGFCFGIRNQRTYPTHCLSLLIGGLILQKLELIAFGTRSTQIGFFLVFSLGMISKFLSWRHLFSQPEVQFKLPSELLGPCSMIQLVYKNPQMGRTATFFGAMGFAVNISTPLQVPFLLHTLHVDYLRLSFVSAAYIGSRFFAAPTIGRLIDTYGSRNILLCSTLLMPLMSLGWSCTKNYECILLTQILAGLIWTSFELCSFGYLSETYRSENRQRAFALKHIAWTLGSSSGAILGGFIEPLFSSSQGVFWTSSAFRTMAALLVFRMLGPSIIQSPDSLESPSLNENPSI